MLFRKPILFLFTLIFLAGLFGFVFRAEASALPAINYAPNLWFDSGEQYYPANPLKFYYENGTEISGQKAVDKYNRLSLEQKVSNLTVLYHIQDYGSQWVYQYWFFYVFNDSLGGIRNEHYGDWEAVYVFVDKESGRAIKTIGTAHQRKIFDTEILNPQTNHIWSYIGNGSHANCIDDSEDGYCDFSKWRRLEEWSKEGLKIRHNDYQLKQITLNFIKEFKGITTLEESSELGVNIFDFLKIEGKEFYLPIGGSPPTHAWAQLSYYEPDEIRPYSWSYAMEKIEQGKDKIAVFFSNLTAKIGSIFKKDDQKVDLGGSFKDFIQPEPEPVEEASQETSGLNLEPEPEPVVKNKPVIVKEPRPQFLDANGKTDPELQKEPEEQPVIQPESPIAPPNFIAGGCGNFEPEPVSLPSLPPVLASAPDSTSIPIPTPTSTPPLPPLPPTPTPTSTPTSTPPLPPPPAPDTTPPSRIIDLLAESGNIRGTINLSWTAPGDDESSGTASEYILKYATSSAITSANWASSTDILDEPVPNSASTTENFSVNGLIAGQAYHFVIQSKDEVDNLSDISNSVSALASSLSDSIVINEVQLRKHEFVELYNPTDKDIDMTGWYWSYYSSNRDWNNPYRNKEFPVGAIIPAHGSYLIGLAGFPDHGACFNSDWQVYNSSLLHDKKGSVAIFPWDPTTKTAAEAKDGRFDALGWGDVDHVYEGTPPDYPDIYRSLKRRIKGWDENDNNSDFIEDNLPFAENSQGQGATIVADGIVIDRNTVWHLSKSPYILESNSSAYPTVENNVTLTIEPGVILKSDKNYPSLLIKGTLKAEGTVVEPITFTAATTTPQAGEWLGIVFDNAVGDDSILDNVIFEYGGDEGSYGRDWMWEMIRIYSSRVVISNSVFRHSQYHGIYLSNSNSAINNSVFSEIDSKGIIVKGANSPVISNCEFENNNIGIEVILESSPIISNNTFRSNHWPISLKSAYPVLNGNRADNNDLNGTVIDQKSIFSQDAVWSADLPYLLSPNVGHSPTVATGTALTLEPGVIVKPTREFTALLIEGELVALGATSTPIIFTSLKDDAYFGDTNNDNDATVPANGDWKNIEFTAGSRGNLDYLHFNYGTPPVLDIDPSATVIQGSNIVFSP
jgi:parallel beta-helix repeat protein